MASLSFVSSGSVSTETHYPVRKDILDKIHPKELCKLAAFIRDLLRETSTFPFVWDPKTKYRKYWVEASWKLIKEALEKGEWKGFKRCTTLIENAEEIFLDQRQQFYCDYIENHGFVEGTDMDEYDYLERNAPATSEELFRLVLAERFLYPKFSSLTKPKVEETQEDRSTDSDWSDVEDEKDYWAKLTRENEAKVTERAAKLRELPSSKQYGPMSPIQLLKDYSPQSSQNWNPNFIITTLSDIKACNLPTPEEPLTVQKWHVQMTIGLRNHMIAKIMRAAFPRLANETSTRQLDRVMRTARDIERKLFEKLRTRETYFYRIAEKIYLLEKSIQEPEENCVTDEVAEERNEDSNEDYVEVPSEAKEAEQASADPSDLISPLLKENLSQKSQICNSSFNFTKLSDVQTCNFSVPEVPRTIRDWPASVTNSLRNAITVELIRAAYPTQSDSNDYEDHEVSAETIYYGRQIERQSFEMATVKDDHFKSVAAKLPEIRKLVEKYGKQESRSTEDLAEEPSSSTFMTGSPSQSIDDTQRSDEYFCVYDVTEDEADWSDIEVEENSIKMAKENAVKDSKEQQVNKAKASEEAAEAKWYSDIEDEEFWDNLKRENAARKAERAKKELEQPKRRPVSVASQEDESGWTAIKAEKFWAKWDRDNEARKVEEATRELKQSKRKAVEQSSHYQKTSSVKYQKEEPKNQEKSQHDADWSDVEAEGYWTKMAKENKAKETKEAEKNVEESGEAREEPNYEDLEEDFLVDTIVPAFEAAGKKLMSFGRIIAGTIKKILEEDEPVRKENNKSEQAAPRQIEMDVLNSSGKKIKNATEAKEAKETRTSVVRGFSNVTRFPVSTRLPYPPNCFPNTHVEEKIGLFGRIYYVNHWSNTISLDNPLGWRPLSYEWETKLTHNKEVYYHNKITKATQWNRPTED